VSERGPQRAPTACSDSSGVLTAWDVLHCPAFAVLPACLQALRLIMHLGEPLPETRWVGGSMYQWDAAILYGSTACIGRHLPLQSARRCPRPSNFSQFSTISSVCPTFPP
jgi:hypothetical protein